VNKKGKKSKLNTSGPISHSQSFNSTSTTSKRAYFSKFIRLNYVLESIFPKTARKQLKTPNRTTNSMLKFFRDVHKKKFFHQIDFLKVKK